MPSFFKIKYVFVASQSNIWEYDLNRVILLANQEPVKSCSG